MDSKGKPSSLVGWIEILEARIAPATFVVSNLLDVEGRAGTLRAAITAANAHVNDDAAHPDVIVFSRALHGVIALRSDLPAVTEALNITGPGSARLTISGSSAHRVLSIAGNEVNVNVSGLTVAFGRADTGGGVLIDDPDGTVTFSRTVIARNTATSTPDGNSPAGGGIMVRAGHLALSQSTVSGNVARVTSSNDPEGAAGGGVFIAADADATITLSNISGNAAVGYSGIHEPVGAAGAAGARGGPGEDGENGGDGEDGQDASEGREGEGGGIFNAGTLTLVSSRITGNTAAGGQGGTGGSGGAGGRGGSGGAAYNYNGEHYPAGAAGEGGSGGRGGNGGTGGDASGGGLENSGAITITSSVIANNVARAGSAGYGGAGGAAGGVGGLSGAAGDPGEAGSAAGGGIHSVHPADDTRTDTITGSVISGNIVVGGTGANAARGANGAPGTRGGPGEDGSDGEDGGDGRDGVDGGKASGGGIFTNGKLSMVQSTVSGNLLYGGHGGIGGAGGAGGLGGRGGSAYRDDLGYLQPAGANGASGAGGAGGSGGAGGAVTGAGIDCEGTLTFENSTALRNYAYAGAGGVGGASGRPFNTNGEHGANGDSTGGGLALSQGFTLLQSTVAQNYALLGGGIYLGAGDGIIHNSTIALNVAAIGGGIDAVEGATLSVISTIIANNAAGTERDVSGEITADHSLIRYRTLESIGGDESNLVGIDPKLALPAAARGEIAVLLPLRGSPAVNQGSNPDELLLDERLHSHARVLGGTTDIGAVESK